MRRWKPTRTARRAAASPKTTSPDSVDARLDAVSESDTQRSWTNRLEVLQGGVSYRVTTRLRFYGALYLYRFDEKESDTSTDRVQGAVLLGGVRITL